MEAAMGGAMTSGVAGPIKETVGGVTSHAAAAIGEMGPAAKAQRKESRKQEGKLRSGEFGVSTAQKQGDFAQAQKMFAGQSEQLRSDLDRNRAAGNLSGGAYTDAVRAAARETGNAMANTMGQIQASSDNQAQANYQNALAIVGKQADRWRDVNKRQGDISMQTTQGATPSNVSRQQQVASNEDLNNKFV